MSNKYGQDEYEIAEYAEDQSDEFYSDFNEDLEEQGDEEDIGDEQEDDEENIYNERDLQNKEAARQLSIILIKRGIAIRLINNRGIPVDSVVRLGMVNKSLWIYWRSYPEKVGTELCFIKEIVEGFVIEDIETRPFFSADRCVGLVFADFNVQLEAADPETCFALSLCLRTLLLETNTAETGKVESIFEKSLRLAAHRIVAEKERLFEHCCYLECTEAVSIVENFLYKVCNFQLKRAFVQWTAFVSELNTVVMNQDKERWRLHACSNEDVDLQAWYHTCFSQDVYRLRGPFWYREAILPEYKKSYDLIENSLTPLEEAALAHVMCSPETTYGDVAGQMYVVQEITTAEEFALFQKLAVQGLSIIKYPRSGRPAKKSFRISFVEGKIYLTWKGKYGNQGVDLVTVTNIFHGINTDVLKSMGRNEFRDNYLSLISEGRSVDLCFESKEEREMWERLLIALVEKEQGVLRNAASHEKIY